MIYCNRTAAMVLLIPLHPLRTRNFGFRDDAESPCALKLTSYRFLEKQTLTLQVIFSSEFLFMGFVEL